MKPLLTTVTIFCLFSNAAYTAETAYVTDQCEILLHKGSGGEYKILQTLKTGDQMAVLGSNPDTHYARVRLQNGVIGWVSQQFLMQQPAARVLLAKAQETLQQLEAENSQYKRTLEALQTQYKEARDTGGDLSNQAIQLQQQVEDIRQTAADALQIRAQRDQYRSEIIMLRQKLHKVELEKEILEKSAPQDWFLVGAGVLLGGLVLGLMIPSLGSRRNPGWDSF